MDWSRPYNATYRLYGVNRDTWADGTAVHGVASANVESDIDKSMCQSGSVTLELPSGSNVEHGYYRLVMVTEQNGGHERFDVSTLYYTTSTRNTTNGYVTLPLIGRSVLYPASRKRLIIGSYAPFGVDGAQYAAELLGTAIAAPIRVEGGFRLDEHIVHDVGMPVLDAALSVLKVGGYMLCVTGRGEVVIREVPTSKRGDLPYMASIISPGVSDTFDTSEVPNRYTAIDSGIIETATNDDPNSVTSTVSRGYEDDVVDTSPKRINGETLHQYVTRRLMEESTVERPYTYPREYVDGVMLGDVIPVTLNGQPVTMRVKRQSMSCDKGGVRVSETASMEVALWQG